MGQRGEETENRDGCTTEGGGMVDGNAFKRVHTVAQTAQREKERRKQKRERERVSHSSNSVGRLLESRIVGQTRGRERGG